MKMTLSDLLNSRIKVLVLLTVPVLMLYAKTLGYGYTSMDEQMLIVNRAAYLSDNKSVREAFTLPMAGLYYRPLLALSVVMDHRLSGAPWFYHFSNIIWHLVAVWLVYGFLELFSGNKRTSFFYTLLFSLHPLMVHAVAWIPGRNDVMLCVFALASLMLLRLYLRDNKTILLLPQVLLYALALLTKENAVVLPLIFVSILLLFGSLKKPSSLILIALWAGISIAWYLVRSSVVTQAPAPAGQVSDSLLNFSSALLLYFGKIIFPAWLSVMPIVKPALLIPGFVTLALMVLVWFKPGIKDKRTALLGLLIFFLLLAVPVWFGSFRKEHEHYEHRIYTSLVGFFLFLSQLRINSSSRLFVILVGIVAQLFFARSFVRMDVYKNEEVFLEQGLKEYPEYFTFNLQKAIIHNAKGEWQKAIYYYNRAIRERPGIPNLYNNRGSIYIKMGRCQEAIEDCSRAISLSKNFETLFYINRCGTYYQCGDLGNAMKDLFVLMNRTPEAVPVQLKDNITLNWTKVLHTLNKNIEKDSSNAALYYRRGLMYRDIQKYSEAEADLKKAVELAPGKQEYRETFAEMTNVK